MKLTVSELRQAEISQDLMGAFFEDINYGADGGIYAELLENRSFEFYDVYGDKGDYYTVYDGGYGWKAYPQEGEAVLQFVSGSPLSEENPHYLRFTAQHAGEGFTNQAYDGIYLEKGKEYRLVFYARVLRYEGSLTAFVERDGERAAQVEIPLEQMEHPVWRRYEAVLTARTTLRHALFGLQVQQPGVLEFDFISLMPADAVAGVFRRDAFELLKAMKPAFLRFPGGCIVEGNTFANRYRFKDTLKEPQNRNHNWNRWAVHNNRPENGFHSPFSHYNQTLGLGYYEYFLLCELIGAKPLPIMNVGMACQYQSYEYLELDSPQMEEMVQDCLDLIEFANGDADTPWGRVRAQMGHPEPFGLTLLGIGNEQWETQETQYFARYRLFEQRIHEKYPKLRLVGSAGPDVTSEHYTAAWEFYRTETEKNPNFVYAIDEHYYMKPEWFLEHNTFYDAYPRTIKVFAGEYAAHPVNTSGYPEASNTLQAALSEAAFLTGVERNADVVAMSAYAPLFSRHAFSQWAPDLIWMDETMVYGTPSYYVQKLFAEYRGTHTLRMGEELEALRREGVFYHAAWDETSKKTYLKLVNTTGQPLSLSLERGGAPCPIETILTLGGCEQTVYHTPKHPQTVIPRQVEGSADGSFLLEGNTFAILIL